MKLTAEERKLLDRLPLDVIVDVTRRRRAMEIAKSRIARGKAAIESWKAKVAEAEADLKTLSKIEER